MKEIFSNSFFEKHLVFTSSRDIQSICKIFFDKTGTTYFNYVKRYRNGSKACLSNRADWMKYFYGHRLFENIFIEKETANKAYEKEFSLGSVTTVLWAGLHKSKVVEQSKLFDIGNGISLALTHKDFNEYYYFAAKNKAVEMTNWYINNIDSLIEFIYYFKDVARNLISEAEQPQNLIVIKKSVDISTPMTHLSISGNFKESVNHKHYFIYYNNLEILITSREIECIKYMIRGYSSAQIGELMNISKRTVEKHLENTKQKLGCCSKPDLVRILSRNGLNNIIYKS